MRTTTITVMGMSCGGCASSVREEIGDIPGVNTVDVDLSSGTVIINSEGPGRDRRDQERRGGSRLLSGQLMNAVRNIAAVELSIDGMTCASCAHRIEKKLNKLDGVTATVNFATEKAHVEYGDGVKPEQ